MRRPGASARTDTSRATRTSRRCSSPQGAAIKPGVTLDAVSNLNLTPTIARLLDLQMPDAKEKVLTEILVK